MTKWTEFYERNGADAAEAALAELERRASALVPDAPAYKDKIASLRRMYWSLDRDDVFAVDLHRLIMNALAQVKTDPSKVATKVGDRFGGQFLTVLGSSGAGKSRMVEAALSKCGLLDGLRHGDAVLRPVIMISAPQPFSRKLIAEAIFRALGMETESKIEADEAWRTIRNILPRTRTSLIVMDEAQHAVRYTIPERTRTVRDELKLTADQHRWPVSFVLVGTRPLRRFVVTDNQIRRRNTFMELPPMELDADGSWIRADDRDMIRDAIAATLERADLKDGLSDHANVANRLAFAAGLEYGRMFDLLRLAAENALVGRSTSLRNEHFASALKERSGCARDRNTFLIDGYRSVRHWIAEEEVEFAGRNDVLAPDQESTRRKGAAA